MSVFSSSFCLSASAAGSNWRDASKSVLFQLQETIEEQGNEAPYTIGFLYISDKLTSDAESILNLFRSVLEIDMWVGAAGIGVCAMRSEHFDKPAISVMLCRVPKKDFCIFPALETDRDPARSIIEKWRGDKEPMLGVIHADPAAEEDPEHALQALSTISGGFLVGGTSSSRNQHLQFAETLSCNGPSGVLFCDSLPVATMVSQGCKPIGQSYTVTRCHDNIVQELDGEEPADIFEQALHSMVVKKMDRDPSIIFVDEEARHNPDALPEEFQSLLKGEVHAAILIADSDQEDYLVRRITSMNNEDGSLTLNRPVQIGDRLMFIHRNEDTMREELSHDLIAFRKRIEQEHGYFEPKGGLFYSSLSRAISDEGQIVPGQINLIREILGDFPLTGFYTGAEISNARLYSHAGILTLFL